MSQATYKIIKSLKDFTNSLGWFKNFFLSNALRNALKKVPDNADSFTEKQAFEVYDAFLNKSGGLLNWLGKKFLSGLKLFSATAFSQKVSSLPNFGHKSFQTLFTAQTSTTTKTAASANTNAASTAQTDKVTKPAESANTNAISTAQTDTNTKPTESEHTNPTTTEIETKISANANESSLSNDRSHDSSTPKSANNTAPSSPQAQNPQHYAPPTTVLQDTQRIFSDLCMLDNQTSTNTGKVAHGGGLYEKLRNIWKTSKDVNQSHPLCEEATKLHNDIKYFYNGNQMHSTARALKALSMVRTFVDTAQQNRNGDMNPYASNLLNQLELKDISTQEINEEFDITNKIVLNRSKVAEASPTSTAPSLAPSL